MNERVILITEADLDGLRESIRAERAARGTRRHVSDLQHELERAEIVKASAIPGDVITMHSTFELTDLDSGKTETYTLVFPDETDMNPENLSVLAPIGTAALGYRLGDEFEWTVPAGVRRLRVSKVVYQPEAAGDWDR